MSSFIDETSDAFSDLPPEMQEALRRFAKTRSDEDLNAVIFASLADLGAEGDASELTDETNFIEDLGLDSLAIAEFVFFFEDVFKIKITNDALSEIKTLGALKAFLKKEMG